MCRSAEGSEGILVEPDRCRRRLTGMRRLLVLVAAVSAMMADPAYAQQDRLPLDVEISAGFDGLFVPGRPVPIRVDLSSTSLSTGQLSLSTPTGPVEVIDFEVAGGGTEEHWALLDAPLQDNTSIEAAVDVDGRRSGAGSTAVRWDRGALLIGVLEGSRLAAEPPGDVRTRILDQELTFATLPPGLLDLGPLALGALDAVAITEEDLDALPRDHVDAVVGWLSAGGTLYVDAAAGPVAALPEAMHPTEAFSRAGAGRVVATDGALAAGRWADMVVPAPNRSIHEDGDVRSNLPQPDLASEVFSVDLGRDLPPLSRLLMVVGIYALLVGPGAHLVLRRRPMARWAAIPVLAVVATGAVYVSGDGGAEGTTVDVIDVIETGPTPLATSRLVVATEEGDRSVLTPPGWVAEQEEMFGFGFGFGFGSGPEQRARQHRTVDGVEISVPAPAGGVAVVVANGPVALDGALQVEAASTGDGIVVGTVTNTTDVALESVAVFVGRSAGSDVGSLGPGEATSFEVEGADQFRFGADLFRDRWPSNGGVPGGGMAMPMPMPAPPPGFGQIVSEECDSNGSCTQCDADGNCVGMGVQMAPEMTCDEIGNCFPSGGCPDGAGCGGPARPGTLTAALWDRGSNALPGSVVTAVGWTTDLPPVVDLGDGVDVVGTRTALVGRTVPTAGASDLLDSASVRSLVGAGRTEDGLVELIERFDLPPSVDGRAVDLPRLRFDLPALFARAAILTPSGEHVIREGDQSAADRLQAAVPPEAVVNGHVFIRVALPFAPPPPGRELVLYEEARP